MPSAASAVRAFAARSAAARLIPLRLQRRMGQHLYRKPGRTSGRVVHRLRRGWRPEQGSRLLQEHQRPGYRRVHHHRPEPVAIGQSVRKRRTRESFYHCETALAVVAIFRSPVDVDGPNHSRSKDCRVDFVSSQSQILPMPSPAWPTGGRVMAGPPPNCPIAAPAGACRIARLSSATIRP